MRCIKAKRDSQNRLCSSSSGWRSSLWLSDSEVRGDDNQRFKSGIDVFALVLTDCQAVWTLEPGDDEAEALGTPAELVALVRSSDGPLKLMATLLEVLQR